MLTFLLGAAVVAVFILARIVIVKNISGMDWPRRCAIGWGPARPGIVNSSYCKN